MIDAGNSLVNVAFASTVEFECARLGGFEREARPIRMCLFRNRIDLCENR
jgi:hypothetical protein